MELHNPEVYDLRPHWCMYKHFGGSEWGVAGDKRHFDTRFGGASRSEGLEASLSPEGAVLFRSKLPNIKCAAVGDFLVIPTEEGPLMLRITEIGDDRSTTLPYYEARGTCVADTSEKIDRYLDGQIPLPRLS